MTDKQEKPTKKELIELLEHEIKRMEELPQMAMYTYVTHYDLYSVLLILSAIVKDESR